jgi:hypothetical protein
LPKPIKPIFMAATPHAENTPGALCAAPFLSCAGIVRRRQLKYIRPLLKIFAVATGARSCAGPARRNKRGEIRSGRRKLIRRLV